jgi:hypothetical protein
MPKPLVTFLIFVVGALAGGLLLAVMAALLREKINGAV